MQIARWTRHFVDFCYPGACASCEGACDGGASLCGTCANELDALEREAACERCAMPVGQHGAPCPHCAGDGIRPFEKIARLGVFRDPLKHLVHQIKYHNRWPLAEYLADRLLEQERVKGLLTETDRLVPVPLHPWRHMARGYNQAQLVAKRLAKRCGIKLVHPVVRLRHTETQTQLHSKEKRYENLRDAFGLTSVRAIRDKHVVVIDDVMTTGATLVSIARTLREAEPASLCAIVLAVADPRRKDFQTI